MQHNPLGFGVTRKGQRYQAQINYAGSIHYLGMFDTAPEAAAAAHGARLLRARLSGRAIELAPIERLSPCVTRDDAGRYFGWFTLYGEHHTTPRYATEQEALAELRNMHELAHA